MEGWNGEDENSVPTVNVSLCCYSRFCMGFEGSYIQKLVWFHCNGQNSRILQTSMDTLYGGRAGSMVGYLYKNIHKLFLFKTKLTPKTYNEDDR